MYLTIFRGALGLLVLTLALTLLALALTLLALALTLLTLTLTLLTLVICRSFALGAFCLLVSTLRSATVAQTLPGPFTTLLVLFSPCCLPVAGGGAVGVLGDFYDFFAAQTDVIAGFGACAIDAPGYESAGEENKECD